jgi:alpha-L-rhamnosidase
MLGKDADAAAFTKLAAMIHREFTTNMLNDETKTYATNSQTANAMPVAVGLAEPGNVAHLIDEIVKDIRARNNGLTAGDVGYRYLLRALAANGRSDVIFDMNNQSERPGYGYQLKKGATSLTEGWAGNGSQNHFMLGHIMEWFYHDLAGIQPDLAAPGFKKVVIKPTPVGDLTWVKASYNSVRGKISSEWKREADQFTLDVTIPPNTTATVYLPTKDATSVTESGKAASASDGVKLLRTDPNASVFEIASGHYTFTCRPE